MNRCVRSFILFLLLFSPFTYRGLHAQSFNLDLNEILTIGQEYSESSEYLFGTIMHIRKLVNGNILVTDRSDNTLRIFDENGVFQFQMGGRGRGPGEFHEITSVEVTDDGEILVMDRFQARVTVFSLAGELLTTKMLGGENMAVTQFIYKKPNTDQFYVGYKEFGAEKDTGHFFHLFDEKLQKKQSQHLSVFDYFFDSDDPFEFAISRPPTYRSVRFGESNIALSPTLYTGSLAIFNTITLEERMFGTSIDDFYQLYDWETRERHQQSDQVGFASISLQGDRFFYRRAGSTYSLLGNRQMLLQFIGFFEEDTIRPHLVIYSAQGEELASLTLADHDIPFLRNNMLMTVIPAFLDDDNRLYLADMYFDESYPVVRVFETNLGELLE